MALVSEQTRSLLAGGTPALAGLRRRWQRFAGRLPVVPLAILIPFVLVAAFAPAIAPYDPTEPVPGAGIFDPPFWVEGANPAALLGTDFQGRDILSRLIYGAQVSLIVGVMGTIVAGGIGTTLGILAGYLGGWADQAIMRVTDAWLALPALVFAIFLATMVGPSMWNIIIILGAVYWTRYARVIRGEVLSLREREFVRLSEIAGASRGARDPASRAAQRPQLGDGAGQSDDRRRDHRRSLAVVSSAWGCRRRSRPGARCWRMDGRC